MTPRKVILVDDHTLFAKALKTLISSFEDTYVIFVAANGREFVDYINEGKEKPDVVLLDVRMPIMDGITTMRWIQDNNPEINVLAITMENDEETITQMIRNGCMGYLLKDVEPSKLQDAIIKVSRGEFVYSEIVNEAVLEKVSDNYGVIIQPDPANMQFKDSEQRLLNYICGTDLGYKEIAKRMSLSPSTIDNKRTELFKKLGVHTRISAVLFAMQHGFIQPIDK